jgi:pyruvate dehydrogenase E2 component (dihydrolipoamide acetyltransferase)
MSIEITMPTLSANMQAGTVARWLVSVGDEVKCGDAIVEIETDKAVVEVQAEQDGVLAEILVPAGAGGVKVGEAIAVFSNRGDTIEEADEPSQDPRLKASPVARRLAREFGLDLSELAGSGPDGRIVRSDVETARRDAGAAATPNAATRSVADEVADAPYEVVKLSSMRKTIARRVSEAKATIPHFYLSVDIRIDSLIRLRSDLNDALEIKISLNDMLIRAVGIALFRVPDANVQYAGDDLRKFARADVSVAVATPGGVVTPVVRDCGAKSIAVISSEMIRLVERARSGRLMPREYEGGTASLSNLGMYGVNRFQAVINPPQAVIVAAGAGRKCPVVVADEVQVATLLSLTGSFDHRVIDGAVGAELMDSLRTIIEKPISMLV